MNLKKRNTSSLLQINYNQMLSEYEVIRLRNIERNNQFLSALFSNDELNKIQNIHLPRDKVKKSAAKIVLVLLLFFEY